LWGSADDLADAYFLCPFGGPGRCEVDVIQQGDQQDNYRQGREYPVELPVALGVVTLKTLAEMYVGQGLGMEGQPPAFPRVLTGIRAKMRRLFAGMPEGHAFREILTGRVKFR
jgi:hypothetical protein